jgi:CPA2 family monovalent cation:H+ antiporter-2
VLPVSLIDDQATVGQLSQLGVVFLLFFMGMEFNLGRLQRVLIPSLMAVLPQTVFMIYLAKLVGPMLNWSAISSLFFGSLLAISSSMVTIRVLAEQQRLKLPHAQLAIGILILEDILAVILLVILSGIAVTQKFDWQGVTLVSFLMGASSSASSSWAASSPRACSRWRNAGRTRSR